MIERSELSRLLKKNSSVSGGLTMMEMGKAMSLLREPEFSDSFCSVCKMEDQMSRAVFDTGLCKGHAFYALAMQK